MSAKGPDNDQDLMNIIRLVSALDNELARTACVYDRIARTSVQEREPLASFTMLSLPLERQSTTKKSVS